MIVNQLVNSTDVDVPELVFTSTDTGGTVASGGVEQSNAITTMVLCNTAASNLTDETINSVTVSVYLVPKGASYGDSNKIISELIVPASETVFFSDEKFILSGGDEIYVGTSSANDIAFTVSVLEV